MPLLTNQTSGPWSDTAGASSPDLLYRLGLLSSPHFRPVWRCTLAAAFWHYTVRTEFDNGCADAEYFSIRLWPLEALQTSCRRQWWWMPNAVHHHLFRSNK